MNKFWLIPLGVFLAYGCDAADDIEARIDCNSVCSRYSECFDEDYDVSGCRTDCENGIDNGTVEQSDLDACENCIDDRSCASATFSCATDCITIVP